MTRPSRVTEVAVIAFLVLVSQSFALAQSINNPSAQADIHATHIASNFVSEVGSIGYYTNPDTNRGYYLIGSINQGQTASNVTTPIVANRTGIIQPLPNETTFATVSKNETNQPDVTPKIPSVTNIYNIFDITVNNRTNIVQLVQPAANKTIRQVDSSNTHKSGGSTGGDSTGYGEEIIEAQRAANYAKLSSPSINSPSIDSPSINLGEADTQLATVLDDCSKNLPGHI